jgi:hypothetical protein
MLLFQATLGAPRRDMARSDPEVAGISSSAAEGAARVSQRATGRKPTLSHSMHDAIV